MWLFFRQRLLLFALNYKRTLENKKRPHAMADPASVTTTAFSLDELIRCYSLLQYPIFVFDVTNPSFLWANKAALPLFNAPSLKALQDFNIADYLPQATHEHLLAGGLRREIGEVKNDFWAFPSVQPDEKGVVRRYSLRSTRILLKGYSEAPRSVIQLVEAPNYQPGQEKETPSASDEAMHSIELARNIPIAVQQFDKNGVLVYRNYRAHAVYKHQEGQQQKGSRERQQMEQKQPQNDFINGSLVDRSLAKSYWGQLWSSEDENVSIQAEVEEYTQTGPRWHAISLVRCIDSVRGESVVLQTAVDITETIQARQQIEAANIKCEFMDILAHEIRTPLHQIIGYVDLLQQSFALGEECSSKQHLEYIDIIQVSSRALMAIINDLLDYSKLENGRLNMEKIPFQVVDLMKECVETMKQRAEEKGVVLETNFQLSCKETAMLGDPNRIRQICLNLLSNAIKFTEVGSVTFDVQLSEGKAVKQELRVSVQDTGIGIDESNQKHLFQKYQQANSSVARNFGGTGLGLAICKGLVEAMGGTISLKSQLHVGTTVTFTVPLAVAVQTPVSNDTERRLQLAQPISTVSASVHSLRILIAEDNPVNQKMVSRMLQSMGHSCIVVDNGQMALDTLKDESERFDLILMDIQMPVLDGIETTAAIRRQGNDIPIVGLTASFQNSQLDYFRSLGMNWCLGKPTRMQQMKELIERIASGKRKAELKENCDL